MRKFLYFISADHRHLQTRLERLAQKGLELMQADGLFTGTFEETNRTDLRYFVVPYGNQKYYPDRLSSERYGWELIGGFNGMAIFKSLPCETPDEAALLEKMKEDGLVHYDKHTIPLMLAVLFVFGAGLLLLRQLYPELRTQWYLSYAGLCLPFASAICFGLFAANLLTLRSYASAWVHGLTAPILFGSVFTALVVWQLDNTGQTWFFTGFLLLLALACFLSFWRLNRVVAAILPAVCLVLLCLGLAFPQVDQTEMGSASLRHYAEQKQVITLEDMGVTDPLSVTGYRTTGTILVHRTTYWEISKEGASCSSEVYSCATTALADMVSDQLRSVGTWELTDEGFVRADGSTVLLRRGKTIAVVSCSDVMDDVLIETVYQAIFG